MEWFYTVLLFAAIFLNLKEVRMITACFIVGWFLILVPHALPSSDSLQENWFFMLIGIEIFFGCLIYFMRINASKALIFLTGVNIINHSLAVWIFQQFGITPSFHQTILRASEICQILSLIIYSPPSIAWFVDAVGRHKRRETTDDPFRMVAAVR